MTIEIEILKTRHCPSCGPATDLLKRISNKMSNIVLRETYIDTSEGQKRAMRYRIMSVPTILINGSVKFIGLPKESDLKRALEEVG